MNFFEWTPPEVGNDSVVMNVTDASNFTIGGLIKLSQSYGDFYMISFIIMFSIIIGLSIIIVIRQWWKNRCSPLIVTQATVLNKRIEEHYIRSKRTTR